MEETTDEAQVQTRSVYWNSAEAAKLFGSTHGEDVFDCLVSHVKQLTSVLQFSEAYKTIVVGGGEHMSQHDIFTICNKCVFLRMAYIYAMDRLGNTTMNFTSGCCNDSVKQCKNLAIVTTVSKPTLSAWNKQFSLNKGKFPHPNPSYLNSKGRTPRLFEYFDESPFLLQNQPCTYQCHLGPRRHATHHP